MKTFAALPVTTCKDNLKFSELEDHEYYGGDFINLKMSVAIAVDMYGKYHAIWSWGSWQAFIPEISENGNTIVLEHTQTGIKTSLRFIVYFFYDSEIFKALSEISKDVELKQWTLK